METVEPDESIARRAKIHRIHLVLFAISSVALCVIDFLWFESLWFYWPVMVWGAVFGVHTLYCKSLAVDEDWADARANRIHDKSYDIGHIRDIEASFKKSQAAEKATPEKHE